MKVKELIDELKNYNMDAKVQVVVDNYPVDFDLTYGGADGVTKKSASEISFMTEGCQSENLK